jgi:hypothetical protein
MKLFLLAHDYENLERLPEKKAIRPMVVFIAVLRLTTQVDHLPTCQLSLDLTLSRSWLFSTLSKLDEIFATNCILVLHMI